MHFREHLCCSMGYAITKHDTESYFSISCARFRWCASLVTSVDNSYDVNTVRESGVRVVADRVTEQITDKNLSPQKSIQYWDKVRITGSLLHDKSRKLPTSEENDNCIRQVF